MNGILITLGRDELLGMITEAVAKALFPLKVENELEEKDIMSVEEVATWLSIKKTAIYQKTHYKIIPFIKKGKKYTFLLKK